MATYLELKRAHFTPMIKDPQFPKSMTVIEIRAWCAFVEDIKNFLGNKMSEK